MSLRVGILCYPTYGGSGVLATELGMALGRRGHTVHFLGTERPRRLRTDAPGVVFHEVAAPSYPVFPHTPYALALASALVKLAEGDGLDVVHAHYAVPHATSAWMAREVLGGGFRIVTTLHGTDITLVGSDPHYLPITRHGMVHSDRLTTPSAWLRDETVRRFGLDPGATRIDVVPNFVDTEQLHPRAAEGPRNALQALIPELTAREPVFVHVSNLRAVKRPDRVIDAFAAAGAGRLLVVGEGPERPAMEARARAAGLGARVHFAGALLELDALLREATAFLLPSETESFGLAAAEALASGVPVVASRVDGLPEVVRHGETGFLEAADDPAAMGRRLRQLAEDPALRRSMGAAARADVVARFRREPVVDAYERIYREVMGEGGALRRPGV